MSKPDIVTLTIGRSPTGRGIEWHVVGAVPVGRHRSNPNAKLQRWKPGLTPTGGSWDCAGSGYLPRLPHSGDVADAIPRIYRASYLRRARLRLRDATRTDTPDGLIRLTWRIPLPTDVGGQ